MNECSMDNVRAQKQPEWSKNAVIYQVNTRQFSPQGTFEQVTKKLNHIKSLGADIVWLMPVHPIGEKHRKGTLGSPYSVKDYYRINSEFGTESDLRTLISAAHSMDLKIILDWVPNHSAWDNELVDLHPEWYAKDHHGNFRPSPWWDWSDIIEFDYSVPELRTYMINAMKYWVENFDVDGFRCDVAGYVPNDFWQQACDALREIKPIFMLAEWENRDLHSAGFNMTYAWSWNETVHEVTQGKCSLDRLRKYYSWNERSWPADAYRMTFVSNHDKNAWDGTQHEQFGEGLEAAIVLSVMGEGMPLIYNSQEAGESKRLAFFEKDCIEWKGHSIGTLYQELIALKKRTSALWNGEFGARMIHVPNSKMNQVISFVRQDDASKVAVLINFSALCQRVHLHDIVVEGRYENALANTPCELDTQSEVTLGPWCYLVAVQSKN